MFTPSKGDMKCSMVGFRESGQKSPHDKVIFEQRLEEGKEQTMEISKGRTTPGKRSIKDKDLRSGYACHLPRQQRRSRGMEAAGEVREVGQREERQWDSHKGTFRLSSKQIGFYFERDKMLREDFKQGII